MKRLALALWLLSFGVPAWADYASVVLADSPYYYYHLGETVGTAAATVGTGAPLGVGVYTGGYTLNQTGIPGYAATDGAVTLNGSSGYVALADAGGPDFSPPALASSSWSVEAWAYPTAATNAVIVAVSQSTPSTKYGHRMLRKSDGTWQFLMRDASGSCGGGNYSLINNAGSSTENNWYHVVMTTANSGSSSELARLTGYVNATQVGQNTSFSGTFCTGFEVAQIGHDANEDFYFTGTIDEVAFYTSEGNSAAELTQAKITAHYNAGMGIGSILNQRRIFQSKRERLKPQMVGFAQSRLVLDAPGFHLDKLNAKFLSRGQYE